MCNSRGCELELKLIAAYIQEWMCARTSARVAEAILTSKVTLASKAKQTQVIDGLACLANYVPEWDEVHEEFNPLPKILLQSSQIIGTEVEAQDSLMEVNLGEDGSSWLIYFGKLLDLEA